MDRDARRGSLPRPPSGVDGARVFGGPVSLAVGAYYEDFYLDAACAASGPEALDGHNGHAHGGHDHADGGLGYHYHLTVDAALRPTFPYTFGPTYRGRVEGSSFTSCGAAAFGFADRRAGRR